MEKISSIQDGLNKLLTGLSAHLLETKAGDKIISNKRTNCF